MIVDMDRITAAAARAELGDLERTDRVNSETELPLLVPGILCIVAAALWLGLLRLVDDVPSGAGGLVPFGVLALIGLVLVLIDLSRRGRLQVHSFEHGLVLERTRGRMLAARYDEIDADLRAYHNPGDIESMPQDRLMLRLGFPGGATYVLDEPDDNRAEATALVGLATRCGAGRPQPIDYDSAVGLWDNRPRI